MENLIYSVFSVSPWLILSMFRKLSFYVYVFYCLEVGIFLVVAPWWLPQVWEQNYFFFFIPALRKVFLNGYFRGAISGLGILNILLAVSEIIQREKAKHYLSSR